MAINGVPKNGSNAALHIFVPLSTASNNGLNLEPSNKQHNDDFGGLSKICKSFANELIV